MTICECSTFWYCSCGPAHYYCIKQLRIGKGKEETLLGSGTLWNCPHCKDKWVLDGLLEDGGPPENLGPEMERRAKALRFKEEIESLRGLFFTITLYCIANGIFAYSDGKLTTSLIISILVAPFLSVFFGLCLLRCRDPLWKRIRTEVCKEYDVLTRYQSKKSKKQKRVNVAATSSELKS